MANLKKGAYRRLFLLLGCLLPTALAAEPACRAGHVDEYARVRYVHDGDTVHLEDGRKVRLIGINTPELAHDNRPEQAYAGEAREFLKQALYRHDNRVALVFGEERHDRHRRTLAHLLSPEGDNFQAGLLQQGLATAIAHPPNLAFTECYAGQESVARCAGRGIWSDPQRAVLAVEKLAKDKTGFQLVHGTVDLVSESAKGIFLFMSELMIGIYKDNLNAFDRAELRSLEGKQLMVRGWVHPASKKQQKKYRDSRNVRYFLRIRHPSAIELSQPGAEPLCS